MTVGKGRERYSQEGSRGWCHGQPCCTCFLVAAATERREGEDGIRVGGEEKGERREESEEKRDERDGDDLATTLAKPLCKTTKGPKVNGLQSLVAEDSSF